jgi:hypothetical protein
VWGELGQLLRAHQDGLCGEVGAVGKGDLLHLSGDSLGDLLDPVANVDADRPGAPVDVAVPLCVPDVDALTPHEEEESSRGSGEQMRLGWISRVSMRQHGSQRSLTSSELNINEIP